MFASKQTEPQAEKKFRDYAVMDHWDYAQDAIRYVHEKTRLNKGMILADINSGTGKLTKHFLKQANTVYCIEHNKQLRQAAAEKFWKNRNFIEMDGTADSTHLSSRTIDVITCGNGMRDCDAHRAIREFKRILKSDGWLVLLENIPLINDQELLPRPVFNGANDPYSKELMQFYYPRGFWERREFQFAVHIRKEELCHLQGNLGDNVTSERLQGIFEHYSQEDHLGITGRTILHIGQPRF